MMQLEEIKAKITPILLKHQIKRAGIFGSMTTGKFTRKSDVDILVEFNGNIGWQFLTLADELEQLLGLKVDLVSRKGVKPRYFEHIQKDLIYV